MGISLRDCTGENMGRVAAKVYDKICRRAA
ncbi:MAG: hypothetical protein MJ041_05565, partial [Acidaminococcaceae bacterium]|nr:hypothetical protein [Acidaminococcaceae bacterium]